MIGVLIFAFFCAGIIAGISHEKKKAHACRFCRDSVKSLISKGEK